ncbi:hypothetical protein [Allosphingosinicella humi]
MAAAQLSIGKLIRAALAALLMLAATTPAFAEVGCLEDGFSHMQLASEGHAEGGQTIENGSPNSGDQRSKAQPAHCAFSHGAHGTVISAATAVDLDPHMDREDFFSSIALPPATNAPDGPYHPPQA